MAALQIAGEHESLRAFAVDVRVILAEVVRVVALAELIQDSGSVPPVKDLALVGYNLVAYAMRLDIGLKLFEFILAHLGDDQSQLVDFKPAIFFAHKINSFPRASMGN